jgi:hypothetical protein
MKSTITIAVLWLLLTCAVLFTTLLKAGAFSTQTPSLISSRAVQDDSGGGGFTFTDKSYEFYLASLSKKTTVEREIERVFGKYSARAKKVAYCESKFNPKALWTNKDGSRDRGPWQINDRYHPHVSDACAYDVKCSTAYAWRMFENDNYTFRRWVCNQKV